MAFRLRRIAGDTCTLLLLIVLVLVLVLVLRGFALKGQDRSDRRIRWIAEYFILIFAERSGEG
jgi:hypothetical protein